MSLVHHYRTLGLQRSASFRDVKKAYRQLVRRYHPDVNPDAQAVERFITINDAYTAILEATPSAARESSPSDRYSAGTSDSGAFGLGPLNLGDFNSGNLSGNFSIESIQLQLDRLGIGRFSRVPSEAPANTQTNDCPNTADISCSPQQSTQPPAQPSAQSLSDPETSLKQDAYIQLKTLLQQQKFPRAVALVEGLAHRIPTDLEVRQWQAIVYQRWGRRLIAQGESRKARIYLKKALRTDPRNQFLWNEVNRDFWTLANLGPSSDDRQ
ncbi:MAG: DnaJ domain-containing protein [Phormidesmis sp.]